MTKNENAPNEQYLIWSKNTKKIVTYKSNVVKEIQQNVNFNEPSKIDSFSPERVTDERFKQFIQIAGEFGFTIYKVIRLTSSI